MSTPKDWLLGAMMIDLENRLHREPTPRDIIDALMLKCSNEAKKRKELCASVEILLEQISDKIEELRNIMKTEV